MTRIAEFFLRRTMLFWSLVTGCIILGYLSYLWMPKLEDPIAPVKQAMVIVVYPGASAHEVEIKVAQLMEDGLRSLPNINEVRSECSPSMLMLTVEFRMELPKAELEQHLDLIRRKVSDLRMRLPQGCYDPIVVDDMTDVYGSFYAIRSDCYDYPELYRYARYIRRGLSEVKGVKRVNIVGSRDEVINITVAKDEIFRNGMIPMQVIAALQGVGQPVSAGNAIVGQDLLSVEVDGQVNDEDEIRDLLITTPQGKTVRLGDIARVERGYAEPFRNGFFVDGKPALAVCIAMEDDAIVPDVGKAVDARLAKIMERVPAGIETEKIFFQADKVNEAIGGFLLNLVESVVIVILVLVFAMGIRSGVIIGFGLILTIALSFPILSAMGTTLQRISLGAFIVAMGMLVDNAVVIIDGILVDRKRGLAPGEYLFRIGRNTAMPLLGATIIAVTAFMSVYLAPGSVAEYASDLFLVLFVSLMVSWVLALVQVPVCAASWLPKQEKAPVAEKSEIMNTPLHRFVKRSVAWLIAHHRSAIVTAVAILALCIYGFRYIRNSFFPDFEYNQFVFECYFPSQSDPDYVLDNMMAMSDYVASKEDVTRTSVSLGASPARYCFVRPMINGGDCYGELIVDCTDYDAVQRMIAPLQQELRDKWPEAYIKFRKYNFSIATTHKVEVAFKGPDPKVLRSLAAQAEEIMRNSPYADSYSVQNNWNPKGKNLTVRYSRADALRAGISRSDIGSSLLAATDGMNVGVIQDNDRMVLVKFRVRNSDGTRIADLSQAPVWSTLNFRPDDIDPQSLITGNGTAMLRDRMFRSVPLSAVAPDMDLGWDETLVRRTNGYRIIEAECEPDPMNPDATPASLLGDIRRKIEKIEIPDGYALEWTGENKMRDEAISGLFHYIPHTLFIILLVLLLLFNSWKKVTLIITIIPFGICGVVMGFLATGQDFTFMGVVGIFGLVGMMVKNAVVLVDEITRLENEEHRNSYDAVIEATASRVRPVILASLTTIVGMIPLFGDSMYGSLAVTVVGGLTVGTIITLMLLPLMYATMFNVSKNE